MKLEHPDITIALEQKYDPEQRIVQLTGTQALLRMLIERKRADAFAGWNTAVFVSGYPGSPLGGFDSLLTRERLVLERSNIVFTPGLNEELAATAVMGSQIANDFSDRQVEGVGGLWFGKTPGLDRALDALKHANSVGTGVLGGAIAVVGDDPGCKSSTIPNSSEYSFRAAQMPILVPADVSELITFGLAGFALSRETGLWVGLKLVTDIADGGALVALPDKYDFVSPRAEGTLAARAIRRCFPPDSFATERDIVQTRLPAAQNFARRYKLDQITSNVGNERIGLIAAGKTFNDLRLALIKLAADGREVTPARLLKLGLIWPLNPVTLREFAQGLDRIVVIEEKHPFIEEQVRTILYDLPERPRVFGKFDEHGAVLFNAHGDLDADAISLRLARWLTDKEATAPAARQTNMSLAVKREAWFCSGCPHSRSTRVPDDATVGGGIGCHTLALFMDRKVEFISQMGGEGAAWIGISPFVKRAHIFQNIGDGTFFHSGSLAVRAAVASGSNVTFKLLRNGAVSMTGGQRIQGGLALPDLCVLLTAEGVTKIVVIAEHVEVTRRMRLPEGVEVLERDQLDTVHQRLRMHPGVSVLIYDQQCAIEKRRERKRLSEIHARQEIFVSKDICEGCGDCGVKSNCMSIGWRDTPFGKKVEVQTTSCNQDLACVDGECPSFFVLTDPRKAAKTTALLDLPEPVLFNTNARPWHALLVGVGGTGVVTVSAIVSHAAWIESQPNVHLDQTGMAQKGGAVVSHLVIGAKAHERPARIGRNECDLLIAFDALSAITRDLSTTIDPTRTLSIINTAYTPTAREVGHPEVSLPATNDWTELLGYSPDVSSERVFILDTSAHEIASLVSPSSVNLFVLGVACQRGLLPVRATSIEQAICLNSVSVEANIEAFRRGRGWVHGGTSVPAMPLVPKVLSQRIVDAVAALDWPTDLCDTLSTFAKRLAEYDNVDSACAYLAALGHVVPAEIARQHERVAVMIARLMFGFRYLKDEYEVARLAMEVRHEIIRERGYTKFGLAIKITPPWMDHASNRKWTVPEPIMRPLFAALKSLKFLRHTPFDPFAWSAADRRERATAAWFDTFALRLVALLTSTTEVQITALLEDVSRMRGYGSVRSARLDEIIPHAERTLATIESNHPAALRSGNDHRMDTFHAKR